MCECDKNVLNITNRNKKVPSPLFLGLRNPEYILIECQIRCWLPLPFHALSLPSAVRDEGTGDEPGCPLVMSDFPVAFPLEPCECHNERWRGTTKKRIHDFCATGNTPDGVIPLELELFEIDTRTLWE